MKICVLGLWYLGAATCLAVAGYRVTGSDFEIDLMNTPIMLDLNFILVKTLNGPRIFSKFHLPMQYHVFKNHRYEQNFCYYSSL